MKAPDMSTITASLEKSLQSFSLNHHHGNGAVSGGEGESSSSSDDQTTDHPQNQALACSDASLELNSHVSLPYHWEQCLDLKTGEIYYINWRNGMKAKEDPRTSTPQDYYGNGDFYSDHEEDDSSYDSEESSSESSPSSSRDHFNRGKLLHKEDHVLVVAGCKSCFMYFMVPKRVEDCPKCSGHLLHFDRSEIGSP